MKYIILILGSLFFTSAVFAAPFGGYRPANTITRVTGEIFDNTTAKVLGAAVTGIDCETSKYNDSTAPSAFADVTNTETVVGTNGQFWVDLTASEMNITDGDVTVKCSASNTNASDYIVRFTTRKTVIADGGIGPKAQAFDGQTLAEGANTLDLEANEISVDNQFAGDKIALFTSAGAYYASSCIVSSTNANERVTTEDNLVALHTVGDYYVIRPDAGCQVTATKLQTAAAAKIVTQLLGTTLTELSAIPTDGTETLQVIWRAVYQRFFSKVTDNTVDQERQLYKAGGSVKLCEAPLTAAGGIYTTSACGAVD